MHNPLFEEAKPADIGTLEKETLLRRKCFLQEISTLFLTRLRNWIIYNLNF